jgi:hypothetical protein
MGNGTMATKKSDASHQGVTHGFGHFGDVSTSDVFRLPQGLFA